jgi:hypothetical protein
VTAVYDAPQAKCCRVWSARDAAVLSMLAVPNRCVFLALQRWPNGAGQGPGQPKRLTWSLPRHLGRLAYAAARRAAGARRPQPGAHADAGGAQGEEDAQAGRRGGRGRGLPGDVLPHRLAGQHAAPLQSPRERRGAPARALRAGLAEPHLQLSARALRCVATPLEPVRRGTAACSWQGVGASCRLFITRVRG